MNCRVRILLFRPYNSELFIEIFVGDFFLAPVNESLTISACLDKVVLFFKSCTLFLLSSFGHTLNYNYNTCSSRCQHYKGTEKIEGLPSKIRNQYLILIYYSGISMLKFLYSSFVLGTCTQC